MLPALLLTIMRKGRVLGAPVISMSTRHMLADIRIRPPRKDAVEQLQAAPAPPKQLIKAITLGDKVASGMYPAALLECSNCWDAIAHHRL